MENSFFVRPVFLTEEETAIHNFFFDMATFCKKEAFMPFVNIYKQKFGYLKSKYQIPARFSFQDCVEKVDASAPGLLQKDKVQTSYEIDVFWHRMVGKHEYYDIYSHSIEKEEIHVWRQIFSIVNVMEKKKLHIRGRYYLSKAIKDICPFFESYSLGRLTAIVHYLLKE